MTRKNARPGRLRQLGWFALLWLAGVAVVGTTAYLIRLALTPQ